MYNKELIQNKIEEIIKKHNAKPTEKEDWLKLVDTRFKVPGDNTLHSFVVKFSFEDEFGLTDDYQVIGFNDISEKNIKFSISSLDNNERHGKHVYYLSLDIVEQIENLLFEKNVPKEKENVVYEKKDRNFKSMLQDGNQYEKVVQNYYRNKGFEIKDVSDIKEYQDMDIDFLISKNNKTLSYEIKADTRMSETGNIVIEHGMHRKSGFQEGWMHKCKADVLCFVDVKNDISYMFNWPKVKENIATYGRLIQFKNNYDKCVGELYLLSVQDAKKHNLILEIAQLSQSAT